MFLTATPVAAIMPHAPSPVPAEPASAQCAPQSESQRIGELLPVLVPDGNVRAMEALAAVMARSDWGRICAAASTRAGASRAVPPAAAAAGERIARRAIAGLLDDMVDGATRFHRTGDFPEWARENRPSTQIGDFLFYRI